MGGIDQIVLGLVALLFAVSVHEAAHAYAALKMGDNTAYMLGRVTLNPIKHLDLVGSVIVPLVLKLSGSGFMFGWAKPVPINPRNFHDIKKGTIIVSAAGVSANLSLAVFCAFLLHWIIPFMPERSYTFMDGVLYNFVTLLVLSVWYNSILCIFNLIPIPPLDGSRIVEMFLPVNLRMQYMRFERFGFLILMGLMFTGGLRVLFNSIIFPLVSILLPRGL